MRSPGWRFLSWPTFPGKKSIFYFIYLFYFFGLCWRIKGIRQGSEYTSDLCHNSISQIKHFLSLMLLSCKFRDRSRTAATSRMEHFVIIVNGWKPLPIITKSSTLDVAVALDLPLIFGVFDISLFAYFQRRL